MPVVEYTPSRFGDLKKLASQVPGPMNLAHRPFVDYYYATRDACRLYLYYDDSGKLIGTLGRELAPFVLNSQNFTMRIATNWYSLQKGVGGELYQYSAKSNPDSIGLMFGGSQDTLNILRHRKWIFMPGIFGYFLNNPCEVYPGEPRWRSASKTVLRRLLRKRITSFASRIPARVAAEIRVREEDHYSTDLLPPSSRFAFRIVPAIEYLGWRYKLSLSFVRYRLFRILVRGKSSGYVILSDWPRQILVAQCDGEDPQSLAYGVLLSILETGRNDPAPRAAFLTSSHPVMQKIFRSCGFRKQWLGEYPFAFRDNPPGLGDLRDASNWLVNFDWGDNGLRPPFLDEEANAAPAPAGSQTTLD